MRRHPTLIGITLFAAVVIGVQILATAGGREYYLTQAIMTAYYSVVVLGLCLVMGYTGQISMAHGAFFAIGGYCSAILTTVNLPLAGSSWGNLLLRSGLLLKRTDLYGQELISVTPWMAFIAALLLTTAIAFLIGYPTLRLRGHYLAMGTLGFGLIVYRILLGSQFTGAADGISSVPPWHILPGVQVCAGTAYRVQNYYVAWGLVGLVLVCLLNLMHSRIGRALCAIHTSELAANAMGINTAGYKLRAFVLSAVLAATAGCFLTHYNGAIGPSEADVMKSVRYVALVAAGGMANFWGALVVGSVLNFLSLRGCFGSMDHTVFGALLILIMVFTPAGPLLPLASLLTRVLRQINPFHRHSGTPK